MHQYDTAFLALTSRLLNEGGDECCAESAHLIARNALALFLDELWVVGAIGVPGDAVLLQHSVQHEHLECDLGQQHERDEPAAFLLGSFCRTTAGSYR